MSCISALYLFAGDPARCSFRRQSRHTCHATADPLPCVAALRRLTVGRRTAEGCTPVTGSVVWEPVAASALPQGGIPPPRTRADRGADQSAGIRAEGSWDRGWKVESTAGGASASPEPAPSDAPEAALPFPVAGQAAPIGGGHGSVPPARYAIIGAGLAGLATAWHLLVSGGDMRGTCAGRRGLFSARQLQFGCHMYWERRASPQTLICGAALGCCAALR